MTDPDPWDEWEQKWLDHLAAYPKPLWHTFAGWLQRLDHAIASLINHPRYWD